jgi:wobble nucleotide-excising tRNase
MIKNIELKGIATFKNPEGTTFSELSRVNFVYGTNGSGKTTVGKVIHQPEKHTDCEVNWEQGEPLKSYLYNEDYVRANIYQNSNLPGIFSMGEDAADKAKTIEAKEDQLSSVSKKLKTAKYFFDQFEGMKKVYYDTFRDWCWNERLRYEKDYGVQQAFQKFRNDSHKLLAQVIDEFSKPLVEHDIKVLKLLAKTVFQENPQAEVILGRIDVSQIKKLEEYKILAEKVIGKEDVPIGALIKNLSNSDWVNSGRRYHNQTNDQCPFCQQSTQNIHLQAQLEGFFDEEFDKKKRMLETFQVQWRNALYLVQVRYESILNQPNSFLDTAKVEQQLNIFLAKSENIARVIAEKNDKPSVAIILDSILPLLSETNLLIINSNEQATAHNEAIADLENQKTKLRKDVWQHYRLALTEGYEKYVVGTEKSDKLLERKREEITKLEQQSRELLSEVQSLRHQITTTGLTVGAINNKLRQYGFVTFSLDSAERKGFYKIIRPDGSEARESLSEGEKTFLTFLYFCESIKGSLTADGVEGPKIVVFDDPISSLDSNVLSIVSTMIRILIDQILTGNSETKQLFLLTHNIYFHKEVTYDYGEDKTKKDMVSFWILKRSGDQSSVKRFTRNPVRSSYEMLWMEYHAGSSIGIHNTMRRILEYYFKVMGGRKIKEIIEGFPLEKREACSALWSWSNDGSHSVMDELFVTLDDEAIELHKTIFREVFINEGHGAHFDMMMNRVSEWYEYADN